MVLIIGCYLYCFVICFIWFVLLAFGCRATDLYVFGFVCDVSAWLGLVNSVVYLFMFY